MRILLRVNLFRWMEALRVHGSKLPKAPIFCMEELGLYFLQLYVLICKNLGILTYLFVLRVDLI